MSDLLINAIFSEDRRNGIEPGFGATINIINGGLECNTKDGRESRAALNRYTTSLYIHSWAKTCLLSFILFFIFNLGSVIKGVKGFPIRKKTTFL